jgi:membrane peptidoglycan carboxypeptidase
MGRDSRGYYDDDQRGGPSGPGMGRGTPSDPSGRRAARSGGPSRPPSSGSPSSYGPPSRYGPPSSPQPGAPRRSGRPGDTPGRGAGRASGMSRAEGYPPDRYESGRRSAAEGRPQPRGDRAPERGERRSMRERAANFARGMSEQLGAVVENARGAIRGRGAASGGGAAGGQRMAPPPAYSAPMAAMTQEMRAASEPRGFRRSRIRLLSRKWRLGRNNPHGMWFAAGFAISGLLLVAMLGASVGGGYYAISYYNANAAQISNVAKLAKIDSTTIYDRNGQVLYVAPKANGVNIYLGYDEISNLIKYATVSTEDRTFFDTSNIGIDWTSTARALLADISKGGATQGGSTITQQLVKNLVLHDNQKALMRKINEAILSIGITESGAYSKRQILEMYLNTIDYSDGNLGIEAAAQNYFGYQPFTVTASHPCPDPTVKVGGKCWANQQLDWAQAAMLVGVPNAPSIYRPNQFTYDCGPNGKDQSKPCDMAHWDNPCVGNPQTSGDCYPDGATAGYFDYINLGHEWLVYHRAMVVLDSLKRDGWIDQATRDKSLAEVLSILQNHKIYSHAGSTAFSSSGATKLAPHFVDYVMQELQSEFGIQDVADAGIKVYTTLDLNLDTYAIQRAQYYIEQTHNMEWPTYCPLGCYNVPPLAKSDNVHNAAVMAMDPYTGDILAMVGSVDYTSRDPKVNGFYNVATSESRSLGSSTKPIFYATAFQMGWNPGIMVQDQPVCFPNPTGDTSGPGGKPVPDFATPACEGKWYTPHNFDNHSFSGNIPLRYGLANSLNIPATEMMSFVGDSTDYSVNAISMATRMGITSLTAQAMGPTTALGTQPISLLQLTNAYGVFATGGKHVAPRSILEIVFPSTDGRKPYIAPQPHLEQVLSPQAAYMITSILTDKKARIPDFNTPNPLEFNDPDLPANNLDYPSVAAKTGTSQGVNGARDIVTMGYSPYMALGVWAGNSDSTDLGNVIGISGAGYIFHDVMAWAIKHYNWPRGQLFPVPAGMARGEFNCVTGLAPYKGQPDPGKCPVHPWPGYAKTSTNIWAGYGAPQPDMDWYVQGQQWLQS